MADLFDKADKKMKGGFFSFATGIDYDGARDLYQQSANQFKLEKKWDMAARAYEQCVFCAEKSGATRNEIARAHVEAGDCMKRLGIKSALRSYDKALSLWQLEGNFSQAGKLLKKIAESLEEETNIQDSDVDQIMDYYQRACDMFEMDDYGKANLSNCMLKVADYAAKKGDYKKAIQMFEDEARKALANTLKQYSAKDYFLKAGILTLVQGDSVTCKINRDRYLQEDPRLEKSREGVLLTKLVDAFDDNNLDAFTEALGEYDDISPLNPWQVTYLTMVKNTLTGGGGAAGGAAVGGGSSAANPQGDDDEVDLG